MQVSFEASLPSQSYSLPFYREPIKIFSPSPTHKISINDYLLFSREFNLNNDDSRRLVFVSTFVA